jgi:phenylalanine-4-hydroxylase
MRRGVLDKHDGEQQQRRADVRYQRDVNRGVAPVTYGSGERPPRGDYVRANSDYTCEQNWAGYTAADHDTYRRLYARQTQQLPGPGVRRIHRRRRAAGGARADPAIRRGVGATAEGNRMAGRGRARLDPRGSFLQAAVRAPLPVTDWIRKPEEFDYIVEPDVFHDLFGHVPAAVQPDVR